MKNAAPFNRYTGLIVLEVNMSNPNGDPDMDSEPRTRELDGLGMISPVSLKRKYRDLVGDSSVVFQEAQAKLGLAPEQFQILETRGRERREILKLEADEFKNRYWDARLFGNTFLESLKATEDKSVLTTEEKKELEAKKKAGKLAHLINTGALQIGVGLSIAPIDVVRMTYTNKSGVEGDKDRGMAPLGFRVVQHGIYYIPFFINPQVAKNTGATEKDLDLFKFITPYVYSHTASMIRSQINILHAWCAEHKNPLGSCPDYQLIDELKPVCKKDVDKPLARSDYDIPNLNTMNEGLKSRFACIEDLNDNQWN